MCKPNLKWWSRDGKKFHLIGNGYSGGLIFPLCDPENRKESNSNFCSLWVDKAYFYSHPKKQCKECKSKDERNNKN